MYQSDQPAGNRASLTQLILDASHALARLDAECLEALAAVCRALGCEAEGLREGTDLFGEAGAAAVELNLFGRLLDVTRVNLLVMRRADMVSDGCASYGAGRAPDW